jgi:uncharacterized integral membrane protein (TIGR00698 family)
MTALHHPRAAQPATPVPPAQAALIPAAPSSAATPAAGAAPAPAPTPAPAFFAAVVPGLALALGVAVAATVIGQYLPLVGSAVPGALAGAAIGVALRPGRRLRPGLKWASTTLLQCSVVLLGAQLSAGEAARVGLSSLPVMLGTLTVCLGAAWLYGRLLGVPRDLRTLIGVGTGICGGSAIAAVSPVIEAASSDVAYAISTIFLFNISAVLAFPLLGHLLGMSQQSFGLFAGTAVNDTSSVVATAATYGSAAASHAVVVKLVRTLMIIPVSLGLAAVTARRRTAPPGSVPAIPASTTPAPATPASITPATPVPATPVPATAASATPGSATPAVATPAVAAPGARPPRAPAVRAVRLVPWFLIGFVVMAVINSAGLIPVVAHAPLQHTSVFLVAVALSAIGLSTDLPALRRAGPRPLLLGALLWVTVAAASLGLQALTGSL